MVVVQEAWTVENGLTTPTLKIKRNQVDKKYEENTVNGMMKRLRCYLKNLFTNLVKTFK